MKKKRKCTTQVNKPQRLFFFVVFCKSRTKKEHLNSQHEVFASVYIVWSFANDIVHLEAIQAFRSKSERISVFLPHAIELILNNVQQIVMTQRVAILVQPIQKGPIRFSENKIQFYQHESFMMKHRHMRSVESKLSSIKNIFFYLKWIARACTHSHTPSCTNSQ